MNYELTYNKIIERSKDRKLTGYKESHHIIPKCMNGSNDIENLVELTAREHYICHKLLHKMYPENDKLLYAYHRISMSKQQFISSKEYEYLRIEHANRISNHKKDLVGFHTPEGLKRISESSRKRNSGENHPMYGRKHTKKSKEMMSENSKGRLHSDETKKTLSKKLKGLKRSEETKRKISMANKGENNSMFGKTWKFSDETKKKMSESAKGKSKRGNFKSEFEYNEWLNKISRKGKISWNKKIEYCGELYYAKDLAKKLDCKLDDLENKLENL